MSTRKTSEQKTLETIVERLVVVEQEVKGIPDLNAKFEKYVTQERFRPVEYIVYGLAGGIMLTVLTTILSGIIFVKQPDHQTQYQNPQERIYAVQYYDPNLRGANNVSNNR